MTDGNSSNSDYEVIRPLLRKYYSESKELWLPPGSTFRQFRLFLASEGSGQGSPGKQRVVKVRDRISSVATLRRWLTRFAPVHAYYSTGRWLDSQNLGPREPRPNAPGYRFAYNVFLAQELYFDVDAAHSLDEAKRWTTKLKESLEGEYGFRDILLVYSGSKGFHLHVYDFDLADWVKEVSPYTPMRELQTQEAKVKIVNHLMETGHVFDADVTVDTRRIIRLPGSVHGKTLNICQIVDDLDAFQPQRLSAREDEKLAG
jgi:DNA primase catalytic subunit